MLTGWRDITERSVGSDAVRLTVRVLLRSGCGRLGDRDEASELVTETSCERDQLFFGGHTPARPGPTTMTP